ncbi:peroxisomal carnitine O-octanoyltransferase-like isoform X2 [Corticium candelabrum]|uniref:peroxisomal carnitine O-octanoyltransferase-like isoform X2 n=1 Tax=Corticium candelabrum TaxID=121492 RepID=UPI002E26138D|nr:peroxisomal carnitine O-octanoyltransferase-like isoform X2 [Corticium candelabrum]
MASTFHYDDMLPPLPVPLLEETCRKYIKSVQPHVTLTELQNTEFIVNMFATSEGKHLQERLKERSREMKNWLEEWWESAYMTARTPIAILSNFGGPDWGISKWSESAGRAERAAIWINVAMDFYDLLRSEAVQPDFYGGQHLSMNQFRSLFACTRMPNFSKDVLHRHFKTHSEGSCPRHIVVSCNGHLYSVDVICNDQIRLSVPELKEQLSHVESHSKSIGKGPSVAALTSTNRDVWAENWKHLANISANNNEILDVIDKALFSVVFSDSEPKTIEEGAYQSLCGDIHNNWFDKTISMLFFNNGTYGNNSEHSPADALTALRFFHFVDERLDKCNWRYEGPDVVRQLPFPRHLRFDLDFKIYGAIKQAVKEHKLLASNLVVRMVDSDVFTKQKAKLFRIRADTIVQLALQLTYRRLHHKNVPTYETAMTRQFYHGRTETVRSCTPESVEWAKSMLHPQCNDRERMMLMEKAAVVHQQMLKECREGHGFDRHLLGLQIVSQMEGMAMPAIFADKSWKASGGGFNFVLSTSSVGGTKFCGGFAPMVEHGYGACYTILPNRFRCQVTAWKSCAHTDADAYRRGLIQSLLDLQDLMLSQQKARL